MHKHRFLPLIFVTAVVSSLCVASFSSIANSQVESPNTAAQETSSERINPADQERDAEISELITRLENSWITNYENFVEGRIIPINKPEEPSEIYRNQTLEALETGKRSVSTQVGSPEKSKQLQRMRQTLLRYSDQSHRRTAMVYLRPGQDYATLILVSPEGKPFVVLNRQAPQSRLIATSEKFLKALKDPRMRTRQEFLEYSKTLYQWLIQPLEAELKQHKIATLMFCVGPGLRGLPFAALYDGQRFLVERYDMSVIPAFSLAQLRYKNLQQSNVLAAGSASFKNLTPLPAVPLELKSIEQLLPQNQILLNPDFTLEKVRAQLQAKPYQILHLATHAEFMPGSARDSFMQFWNQKLYLRDIDQLGLNHSRIELLVFSACKTALGDTEAELGFSGLALYAGVPSAIGSLWSISDPGTLAFMNEFYQQLQTAPTRAAALRQTQIKMLSGTLEFRVRDLYRSGIRTAVQLPPELTSQLPRDLSSPFYWAPFVLVGNPW